MCPKCHGDVKFYILFFVLFNPNFGVLFDRTGVCTSTAFELQALIEKVYYRNTYLHNRQIQKCVSQNPFSEIGKVVLGTGISLRALTS